MNQNILRVAHLNVRSLTAHFPAFLDAEIAELYDIIAVTETWLKPDTPSRLLAIEGYFLERLDRIDRVGGGVAFYIRDHLRYERLNDCDIARRGVESLTFCVGGTAFCVMYRPDHDYTEFLTHFEDLIDNLDTRFESIVILGDLNVNMLAVDGYRTFQLVDIIQSHGFEQLIDQPTRVTSTSSSLIDVIITNHTRVDRSGVERVDVADHDLIFCDILVGKIKQPVVEKVFRSFASFNNDDFLRDLNLINWSAVVEIEDINEKVRFFRDSMVGLFEIHAPLRKGRFTRAPAPWITHTIREMMKLRDRAQTRYRRTGAGAHGRYYRDLRNMVRAAVSREKRAYFQYCVQNKSPKETWNSIRNLGICNRTATSIPTELGDAGAINRGFLESLTDHGICADTLGFYEGGLMPSVVGAPPFGFVAVCEGEVAAAVRMIKSNAVGDDGISMKMIRMCAPAIMPCLAHIVNSCLVESVFPESWKVSLVIPVPKKTKPQAIGDLRPISILPALSKILEKIAVKQLTEHLKRYKILPEVQSGFRSGYSCVTALANVVDDVVGAKDKGLATALVLLDFSRAFDTLNHNMLFAILKHVGLGQSSVDFFRSYLSGRKQKVFLRDCSEALDVRMGVQQGSIMGPILFSVYTSGIKNYINKCKYHLYADDTQLYHSFLPLEVDEASAVMNRDLAGVLRFSVDHGLRINPSKTLCVVFGPGRCREHVVEGLDLSVDGVNITFKDTVKNLGVHLDSTLRFREHVTVLVRRAYASLRLLYSHRSILTVSLKRQLCEALVLSHLNYCDVLYGSFLDTVSVGRLQRVQNSCLRYIFGIRRNAHISHKLLELNWLNMGDRRYIHTLVFYFKILKFRIPLYLYNRIIFRGDIHNVATRNRVLIQIPRHRTQLFKRTYSYRLAVHYNEIRSHLGGSVASFVRGTRESFLAHRSAV